MSGGSFNYLCFEDAGGILGREEDIADMAAALREIGAGDIADRTEAILQAREALEAEVHALSGVWYAVEWWKSADFDKQQVAVAIGRYRRQQDARASADDTISAPGLTST